MVNSKPWLTTEHFKLFWLLALSIKCLFFIPE